MLVLLLLSQSEKVDKLKNRTSKNWVCCYEIFRENNRAKRAIFFQTPFIQFLWTTFITESPKTIISHCKELLGKEEG